MTTVQDTASAIDAALQPLGFIRDSNLAQVRWSADTHGRRCLISIAPRKRTRYSGEVRRSELLGHQLRIELGTAVSVRLFFVRAGFAQTVIARWIYRLRRQQVIADVPAALQGFCLVTPAPDWSQRLLHDTDAVTATAALLSENAAARFAGSVHFGPDTVYYASPIVALEQLTALRTLTALDRLETVAVGAERLPRPAVPARSTRFEAWARRSPLALALAVIAAVLLMLMLGAGLLIGMAALLLR